MHQLLIFRGKGMILDTVEHTAKEKKSLVSRWKVLNASHMTLPPLLTNYEADLHQIIKSGQALTNEHVQYFVYQILRGPYRS